MMPIAAAGRSGTDVQETIVSVLLFSLSFAMVAACASFLIGAHTRVTRVKGNNR
jgi:hypothetical protein